jgi:hypothetical protein
LGHLSRNTLRVGVLDVVENVGDVFAVSSVGGAVTTVSLGPGGGSLGSLASTTVSGATSGACAFILALVLVGGINTRCLQGFSKARMIVDLSLLQGELIEVGFRLDRAFAGALTATISLRN